MKRSGFTLIELVIALAISSMLLSMLYQIFKQIRLNVSRIETTVDWVRIIARVEDLIDNDISCAYIPRVMQDLQKTSTGQQSKPIQEQPDQRYFYAQRDGERIKRFTCLTTHHIAAFGERSANTVRIQYMLEPLQDNPDLFILKRQESSNFDLKNFEQNKVRAYEIARRIKTFSMTFYVLQQPKDEKEKKEKEKKEVPAYDEFSEWGTDELKKKIKQPLPDYVLIKGTILDMLNQEHAFELRCAVYARPEEAKKEAAAQDKVATETGATPPAKPTSAGGKP